MDSIAEKNKAIYRDTVRRNNSNKQKYEARHKNVRIPTDDAADLVAACGRLDCSQRSLIIALISDGLDRLGGMSIADQRAWITAQESYRPANVDDRRRWE